MIEGIKLTKQIQLLSPTITSDKIAIENCHLKELLQTKYAQVKSISVEIDRVSADFKTFSELVGGEVNNQVLLFFTTLKKKEAQNNVNTRTEAVGELNSFKATLDEIAAKVNIKITEAEIKQQQLDDAHSDHHVDPGAKNSNTRAQLNTDKKPCNQHSLPNQNPLKKDSALVPFKGTNMLVDPKKIETVNLPNTFDQYSPKKKHVDVKTKKPNLKFQMLMRKTVGYGTDWTAARSHLKNTIKSHLCECLLQEKISCPLLWTDNDLKHAITTVINYIEAHLHDDFFSCGAWYN